MVMKMFKKFIKYYYPYKKLFFKDMAASVLASLIALLYPILTNNMLTDYIPNKNKVYIIYASTLLFLVYVVRAYLNYFVGYQGHMLGEYMRYDMRNDMFTHLEKLPYKYYDDNETGKIMSRLTNDLFNVSEFAHHAPEHLLVAIVMFIGSFIYLSAINLSLTLIIFLCIPILIIIVVKVNGNLEKAYSENKRKIASINSGIESSISGIRVTKAYINEELELEKFINHNQEYVDSRRKTLRWLGIFNSSTMFITDIFNIVVLLAGGLYLYNGQITFASYSTFIISVNLFIRPINYLISFIELYQDGITGFKRYLEIMDKNPEDYRKDKPDLLITNGKVVFKTVSFAYDEEPTINNISFTINAGEKVALVGPSGGGKTTICHLLPDFYNVDKGSITIDNTNITDVNLTSLRKNIGIVQQDVFLFNESIKENIRYGNLNASDEDILLAAKKAKITDFVNTLPAGFDTIIGERGIKLSGGQKQRLSIARVFLKDPKILILDEATSALDNYTEYLIQEALDDLTIGRTTIIVAHRLSTIRNANRIIFIADGKIVEQGTHDELMKKQQAYYELYTTQFKLN